MSTLVPTAPPPGAKPVIVGGGGALRVRGSPRCSCRGSDTLEATVAVLTIVPAEQGVTVIVAVALAVLASEPRSQRSS